MILSLDLHLHSPWRSPPTTHLCRQYQTAADDSSKPYQPSCSRPVVFLQFSDVTTASGHMAHTLTPISLVDCRQWHHQPPSCGKLCPTPSQPSSATSSSAATVWIQWQAPSLNSDQYKIIIILTFWVTIYICCCVQLLAHTWQSTMISSQLNCCFYQYAITNLVPVGEDDNCPSSDLMVSLGRMIAPRVWCEFLLYFVSAWIVCIAKRWRLCESLQTCICILDCL